MPCELHGGVGISLHENDASSCTVQCIIAAVGAFSASRVKARMLYPCTTQCIVAAAVGAFSASRVNSTMLVIHGM